MKTKLPNNSLFEEVKNEKIPTKFYRYKQGANFTLEGKNNFSYKERESIVINCQSNNILVEEICKIEGITPPQFNLWSKEFSSSNKKEVFKDKTRTIELSNDDKYRIVLEGQNGEHSIAEICKKENITYEEFLQWSEKFLQICKNSRNREKPYDIHTTEVKGIIENLVGEDILEYFENFIDVTSKETIVIRDHHKCSEDIILKNKTNLVCLSKINDIRNINKHFELVNSKLPLGGVFIGCLETLTARRERINKIGFPILNYLYLGAEFLIKRILPKLAITKKYYFNITKGKGRLMSKAEGLGRLVSCGFRIKDYKNINGLTYFIVKKDKEPSYDMNPSYGPIYKMPRIGKNGKIIKVYKFRTMHPYSEYLQDYVLKANGYAESGKPAADFRIPTWGKFLRKFWIDEIPQLINVLNGDMKLVGIRPVSERYFQDIPKEMQKLRLTQKPGCIPPYVALNRDGNVMSVLQSEKEYLEEKTRNPYTTDTIYFFKAIFNIVFNHKRSA